MRGALGSYRRPAAAVVALALTAAVSATSAAGASAHGRGHGHGPGPRHAWIERTIARMTLPEEVGQLFEINGYGTSVDDTSPATEALNQKYYGVDTMAQLIRRYHPGGIIYYNWSNGLTSPAQVAALSTGVQRTALSDGAGVPDTISVDQEGGTVLRIGSPATVFPGNMAVGADGDLRDALRAGRIGGRELRAMGINVDDAPVIDVNLDPLNQADGVRAFGDRPDRVAALGAAEILGYQSRQRTRGVAATAKHWPGFGAAPVNSDSGTAISQQSLADVQRDNLPPFRAAIAAGVDQIMVTHILFPKVTGSSVPTSLSRFWVDGLLRGRLHYDGPVVTDALDAAALHQFTPADVALRAIRAGDDVLNEVGQTPTDDGPADLVSAYPAVLAAVRDGTITRARLDESVTRILALKLKLGIVERPLPDPDRLARVGTPRHLAAAQRIADRSVTLLRNDAGTLPLHPSAGETVLVTGYGQTTTATLGSDLAARGLTPQVLATGSAPTDDQIAGAVSAARRSDLVVVTTDNVWQSANVGQQALVRQLVATGTPVVVAAVGTPYDVAYLPDARTFLASYGYQPPSLAALVGVMLGTEQPLGRLPVTITQPPPSTQVLYPFGYGLSLP